MDTIIHRWGDSKIVPGHGQIGDKEIVAAVRQYFIDMTAAKIDKYKDWMTMPSMASPGKTIEYIKSSLDKK